MDNLTTTQLASQYVGLADSIDLDAADFSPRQLATMRASLADLKSEFNARSCSYFADMSTVVRQLAITKSFVVPGTVDDYDPLSLNNAITRYANAIDDDAYVLMHMKRPETREIIVTIIAKRFTEIAKVVELARYEMNLDATTFMGGYVVEQKSLPGNHETVAYTVSLTYSNEFCDNRNGIVVVAPSAKDMP